MYQLKRKDLQAPLPHLSVCNSGHLVFLGMDYQTFLHTQHPCAQAELCSNVQGKCWPWHSKNIKLSSSSQVSLLKTTTRTDRDRFLHLSSSLGNTQAITRVPAMHVCSVSPTEVITLTINGNIHPCKVQCIHNHSEDICSYTIYWSPSCIINEGSLLVYSQ